MDLPRGTLTAAPLHRKARGLTAILVSFDKKVQQAIRRLLYERMDIESKLATLTRQLDSVEQNLICEPKLLTKLKMALADNTYNITRLGGQSSRQIVASLQDPAIQAELQNAVLSEEDAEDENEARLRRRELARISIPVRLDAPYRHAGSDSPNAKGQRSITNVLNSKTGEEGLSYYQKSQLTNGRGRRGSTAVAGAWEQVWQGQ